jgi:hypothetical protein
MATKAKTKPPTDGQLIADAITTSLQTGGEDGNVADGLFAVARALDRIADVNGRARPPVALALERVADALEMLAHGADVALAAERATAPELGGVPPTAVDEVTAHAVPTAPAEMVTQNGAAADASNP